MVVDIEREHNGTPESSLNNVSADADAWISPWHAKDQVYTVPFPVLDLWNSISPRPALIPFGRFTGKTGESEIGKKKDVRYNRVRQNI